MNDQLLVSLLDAVCDGLDGVAALCLSRHGGSVTASAGLSALLGWEAEPIPGETAEPLWARLRRLCTPDPGDLAQLAPSPAAGLVCRLRGATGDVAARLTVRDLNPGGGRLLILQRLVDADAAAVADVLRYEQIVSASSDALLFIDRQFRYQAANQAYLDMWQLQRHELIGQPVERIVGEAFFRDVVRPRLVDCLGGARNIQYVARVDHMPSTPRYIEATYSPSVNGDGEIDGVVVNIRNVTERVEAEQRLLRSEQRWRGLLAALPDMMLRLDCTGTILDYKPPHDQRAAQDLALGVGQAVDTVWPEAVAASIMTGIGRALAQAAPLTLEVEDRVGDPRALEFRMIAVGGGEVIATVRDVTAQRQASQREHMLSQMVEQSPDAILVTDEAFRVTYLNASFEKLFGWTLRELQGESPACLNAEADAETMQQRIYEDLLAGRIVCLDDVLNRRKDGSLFHCRFWVSPLLDAAGRVIGYVGSQRDVSRQVEAIAALAEREAWNRRLVETAMEGIWVLDADALTTWVNPRLLEMLGYDETQLLGRPLFDFLDEARVTEAREGFERHRRGERFVVELAFRRRDGSLMPTIVSATPMFDEQGDFLGAFGMLTDISERVAQERQREELLQRQRILLDHLPALVIFKDTENRILLATESVASATGLPRSEIEGQPSDKVYPDLAERYYADDLEVLRTGRPKRGILEPLQTADGRARWLQTDKVPYFDAHGEVAGIVVFALDVTDRREAELALVESERRFRTLFEQIPQGVVLHALDGRIMELNPAACQILGIDREQVLGLASTSPEWRCVHEDGSDFPGAGHPAMVALRTNETVTGVVMGVHRPRDGELVWIRVDAVPLVHADSGEPAGVFASFTDITESRLMQQALVQSQKMEAIGQLAGGIAHDFNNILGSILGFCELAQLETDPADDRLRGYLSQIDSAAMRAGNLVRQLLLFGRGEAASTVAPAALHVLLPEAAELLRPLLPPTITLDLQPDSTVSPLVGIDPLHLQQILLNLGSNAKDAMGDRGTLRLATGVGPGAGRTCLVCGERIEGEWARLLVSDSGHGIPHGIQDKVFQPFFTTKPVGRGSGMGLAIVAGLLRTHRGHALLHSSPGEGTCFELLFPLVDAKAAGGEPADSA